jgi:hypothetical protein
VQHDAVHKPTQAKAQDKAGSDNTLAVFVLLHGSSLN